jgi:nucleoside-diphosphate-sugar epimerase
VLYRAAQEPKLFGEVYFATHEEHLAVLEIAERIIEVLGRGTLNHVDWPDERKRIEIDDVKISSTLLRSLTGWKPRYSFSEGLARTKQILESEGKPK